MEQDIVELLPSFSFLKSRFGFLQHQVKHHFVQVTSTLMPPESSAMANVKVEKTKTWKLKTYLSVSPMEGVPPIGCKVRQYSPMH
jgi:hypothetical protein